MKISRNRFAVDVGGGGVPSAETSEKVSGRKKSKSANETQKRTSLRNLVRETENLIYTSGKKCKAKKKQAKEFMVKKSKKEGEVEIS